MNKKRYVVYAVVFLVLAVLVYLQFRTWQNFDWARFRETRPQKWNHVLHGIALIYLAYVVRAIRWKIFLRPVRPQASSVSLVAPKGAFYAYPSLDIPEDDLTFVTDLLKQKHVLAVHGSGFGQKPGTRHMRIVFLPQDEVLSAAYEKISDFMRERYT